MRPSFRLAVPLLLALALSSRMLPEAQLPRSQAEAASAALAGGSLEQEDGLLILRLSGSPYEIGYQHGSLLAGQIRARLRDEMLGGIVWKRGVSHALLLRHARQIDALLPEEYSEELRGLADGAGISYSEALLLNTAGDMVGHDWPQSSARDLLLSLSPRFWPHSTASYSAEGASASTPVTAQDEDGALSLGGAVAVFGLATSDGALIHAAWFAHRPALDDLFVVVCRPEAGDSFLGVGRPGEVGFYAGVNEEGISVTGLHSPSQDASLEGIPLPLLLREALQYGGDIPATLRILGESKRTTGHNVVIGDSKRPDAQAVEFSAHLMAVFASQNYLAARTEHYLDERLAEGQIALPSWDGDRSWQQMDSLLTALKPRYGTLDLPAVGDLVSGLAAAAEEPDNASEDSLWGIVLTGRDPEIWLVTGSDGELSCGLSLDEEA